MQFKFKLEALRRYRNFQEELIQKELAEAQRSRDREMDLLDELIDKRVRAEQGLRSEQEKSTSGPHIALYDNYLKRLSEDIRNQQKSVKAAEAVCEQKMRALLEAMQKRKALDKLKTKGLQTYIETLNHQEQKFLNELALNRFARTDN